ncbi:MAG TPA: type II secretion system F family protein [Acidimicrobiales bacterium]|nr:type II secretion system F family protein [Acidimicrobiales bacterium]
MTKFKYEALADDGSAITGVVRSDTIGGARMTLLSRGIEAPELEEKKSLLQLEITKARVGRTELMHFSRQLAAFLRSGIPILEGIEVLREGAANKTLRRVLAEVGESLRAGETFLGAITAHPRVFPEFYRGMIGAAELTGQLDSVLDRLAHYLERDLEAKRKIRSALAYPLVVLGMSIVTVCVLTIFVLPRFRTFFDSLNTELPLPTRMLLAATDFLADWWYAFAGLALVLLVAGVLVRRSPRGRARLDAMVLRLPAVGETVRYAVIERFCRVLASMAQAGVPLPEAMTVAGDTANNAVYRRALAGARERMIRGEGIARPIAATELFPVAAVQMFRVGEDTGSLDQQLETAAEFFEQELDYKIKKLTTLFEPAVIVVMGVVVGFVAIALVSAMYGIFQDANTVK